MSTPGGAAGACTPHDYSPLPASLLGGGAVPADRGGVSLVKQMLRHGPGVRVHECDRRYINGWREWPRFVWCVAKNVLAKDLCPHAARRRSPRGCRLLAVSDHHVFFSQSARGYSAYVLFGLLATGLPDSCGRR